MSEGLRAEDVKEALAVLTLPHGFVAHGEVELRELTRHSADAFAPAVAVLAAAARAWLASQATTEGRYVEPTGSSEQTPDYEAAAKAVYESIEDLRAEERLQGGGVLGNFYWSTVLARAAVDAALVGFPPPTRRRREMMYRCIRCEDEFTHTELTLCCPRAPDMGPHETLNVRRGSSLHESSCPRSDPSPLVAASCACRRIQSPEVPT